MQKGPKRIPSNNPDRQYYGFVLYLSTFVAAAIYITWALVPDDMLEAIGITYYPQKYWAVAIPVWVVGLIPFTLLMFTSVNLLNTPPLSSINTITDKSAHVLRRNPISSRGSTFPPLEDAPVTIVNEVLYS
ncbi:hypothetical protein HDU97_001056 [Phlyctochytrium planicorne]|nr:hypothetical protein HDU97_001056 [Phlyctochytrium planicorne]